VLAFAGAFFAWGFPPHDHRPFTTALLESAESIANLLHESGRHLTRAGETFQLIMRVLGPGLLALAVLAIRGRIKR
jgi:hypothetical protein